MHTEYLGLEESLSVPLAHLLTVAGLGSEYLLSPLPGGANNRVFRVDVGARTVFLKVYFHHKADSRDRLGAEFAFSTFAWDHGVRCIPQPLACDRQQYLGLYAFIHGRRFSAGEVTPHAVDCARAFFEEVNRYRHLAEARALPRASEARFTVVEHVELVEQRVQRLLDLPPSTGAIDREASVFVRTELAPRWRRIADAVTEHAATLAIAAGGAIAEADRCLSPSDFGFHNALVNGDGSVYFVDFEYAGWDDPARTACDFFWQPAVPVPPKFYDAVVDAIVSTFTAPAAHRRRIALMLPVYGIKWCCIALNDFLPVDGARRFFAGGTAAYRDRKSRQLEVARDVLKAVIERSP